ncbi:conserved domain protein, partial [delta proteobacterium NaphS2]
MKGKTIKIRLMKAEDYDAVIRIDEKVLKTSRPEYYNMKFEKLFQTKDYLPVSLVAEDETGRWWGSPWVKPTWENTAFSRERRPWTPSELI